MVKTSKKSFYENVFKPNQTWCGCGTVVILAALTLSSDLAASSPSHCGVQRMRGSHSCGRRPWKPGESESGRLERATVGAAALVTPTREARSGWHGRRPFSDGLTHALSSLCLVLPTPSNFPNFSSHQNHIEILNIANDTCMKY